MSAGIFYSRLLEGLICGPCITGLSKKPQNLVYLFSVVTKIANNRFVHPLQNVVFFISSIILSLTDQLRILCI